MLSLYKNFNGLYVFNKLIVGHQTIRTMVVKVNRHFDSACALITLVKGFDIVWFNIIPGLIGIAVVFKMDVHDYSLKYTVKARAFRLRVSCSGRCGPRYLIRT